MVTTAELDAAPTTLVWIESLDRVWTSHASPDCKGINRASELIQRAWADATGDLFCAAGCIDVAKATLADLLNISKDRKTAMSVKELEKRLEAADDKTKGVKKLKTGASEKQMDFIARLMSQKGRTEEPISLITLSDNQRSKRGGQITKSEASEIIEFLMSLPDVAFEDTEGAEPWEADRVVAWIAGRRIEHSMLDNLEEEDFEGLELFAREWAKTQTDANFDWLRDVATKAAAGQWMPNMTKGVLNCFRNAANAAPKATPAAPAEPTLSYEDYEAIEGIHVIDGAYLKLQHNLRHDAHYVKVWTGSEWEYDGKRLLGRLSEATRLTREQAKEWGDLYGTCCHCGRELTDEDSLKDSMGPWCAKKYRWAA